jgi:hypothetical protein
MPRGGKRQGTPGKAYSNRTDMATNYDMDAGSPATGGMKAPAAGGGDPVLPVYPDQIPSIDTPTMRPDEPISDGLPVGPGRGREGLTNYDPRLTETQQLKKWLPILEPIGRQEDTPDSVRTLIRYIRGS